MKFDFNGKTALVTGAAQGIGAAIAISLAEANTRLVLADIKAPTATIDKIQNLGGIVRHIPCDVSMEDSVDNLQKSIVETEKKIDFAINAAGILSQSSIVKMRVADFDRIIAVNLRGSFLIAQCAARMMLSQGEGKIILISSELAYLGREEFSAYCCSKSGVVGLTRSLARELAPAIQVNSVAPGPVDTPMLGLASMSQEWIDRELDIPLKRVGKPTEISSLVCYLCCPEAGFFTGQTISPNGGAVML